MLLYKKLLLMTFGTTLVLQRVRFACWITKVINTHSEYVMFLALTLKYVLRGRFSALGYTYLDCLVYQ